MVANGFRRENKIEEMRKIEIINLDKSNARYKNQII